jgi:hypothetical protein
MSPPRYRTLDGDEVELPLAMDEWVLVPRALARFDPELAWTLDYDDAPEPEDADPRLDFSTGALLVPVARWNEHADLEPNLAPCHRAPTGGSLFAPAPPTSHPTARTSSDDADPRFPALGLAAVAARSTVVALAALASAYVIAVGAWLWSLRDGISGPDVSSGLILVGVAVLLAWLTGIVGVGWRRMTPSARPTRSWPDLRGAVLHLIDDPLGILRAGLALQLTGFAVLVIVR